MSDTIATAWLLSFPFVLWFAATQSGRLFAPQHLLARLCLYGILMANIAMTFCRTMDFELRVFGAEAIQYGGVALLAFIWIRGVWLCVADRQNRTAAER